ncbi:hypothetical protein MNEG_10657 [Monoraphidium neglectum]|uniref:Uncharacterized protein n=1 Tax=Monoraphidium neglectum TaxID=145388 RepID=A0A0D2JC91_9CHLO|nr:hypothetical protein MNEG_10657 [Monoraphidium neglectum]KIY97307.1 hypothetical protein MNEG_10657 [Monoraphidium neglectum]|eukprot:XP_013896327.1 hypothetical protein MNEG_10657 [Monoraphidium neglectum]
MAQERLWHRLSALKFATEAAAAGRARLERLAPAAQEAAAAAQKAAAAAHKAAAGHGGARGGGKRGGGAKKAAAAAAEGAGTPEPSLVSGKRVTLSDEEKAALRADIAAAEAAEAAQAYDAVLSGLGEAGAAGGAVKQEEGGALGVNGGGSSSGSVGAEADHLAMWAHEDLAQVLVEHMQWQEAHRMVRHMEAQARADANLEVAWLAAEAAERKAREAAGAAAGAAGDADAARRGAMRRQRSMPVHGGVEHDGGDAMGAAAAAARAQQFAQRDKKKRKAARDYEDEDYVMGMKQGAMPPGARPPQPRAPQTADPHFKRLKMGGGQGAMGAMARGDGVARVQLPTGAPRAALPRQASTSTPHLWAPADDDMLCAMVRPGERETFAWA